MGLGDGFDKIEQGVSEVVGCEPLFTEPDKNCDKILNPIIKSFKFLFVSS